MSVDPTAALPRRPSPGAAGARLGELYADHSRMVYGICRMLLRDPNEAEDATQQVFLAAYRNLLTGTEVRDPAAWLGTIARNACRRRSAIRMREPYAVGEDELTRVSPGVEETAIRREQTAALYAELGRLPEKQREAVVLRDLFGLRYDEVAKALDTSRPAVEALLFRGRRRLQRRLRPGLAAGVLVVPLAVQESIAYAVPGFAGAAAPAGAAATAAGIPLLAKLAAGGAAISLAGSAGVVAERGLHDPPARPAHVAAQPRPEPKRATIVPLRTAATQDVPSLEPASFRPAADDSGAARSTEHPSSRKRGGGDDDADRAAGAAASPGEDRSEPENRSGRGGGTTDDHEAEPVERRTVDASERDGESTSGRSGTSERSGSSRDSSAEPEKLDEPDQPDETDEPDEPQPDDSRSGESG